MTLNEGERKENAKGLIKFLAIPDELVSHFTGLVATQQEREKAQSAASLAMTKGPMPEPATGEPVKPEPEEES